MLLLLLAQFTSITAVSLPQCHCTEYIACTESNPIQKTFPECVDHCNKKHPDPLPPEYLPCLLAYKEELTDTIDCIFEKVGMGCSSNEGNVIKGKNTTEMFRESVRHKLEKYMDAVGAIWEYKTEAAEKINRCLLRCFYPGRNVCTISMKCILYVPSDPEMADQLSSCARDSGIKAKERRKLAQCFALVTKKDDSTRAHSERDEEEAVEREESQEQEQHAEVGGKDENEESPEPAEVESYTSTSRRPTHKPRRPFHITKGTTAYTVTPIPSNPINLVPVNLGTSQMSSIVQSPPNPVPVQGSSVAQAPTEDAYRVAPKPPKYPPRVTLTSESKQNPEIGAEGSQPANQAPSEGTPSVQNVIVYPIPSKQTNPIVIPPANANQGNSVASNQVDVGSSDQNPQPNPPEQTTVPSAGITVYPVNSVGQNNQASVQNPVIPVKAPVDVPTTTTAPPVAAPVGYTVPTASQEQQINNVPISNIGESSTATQDSSAVPQTRSPVNNQVPQIPPASSSDGQNPSQSFSRINSGAYPSNLNHIISNPGNDVTVISNSNAYTPSQAPPTNQVQSITSTVTQAPPTEVKPACSSVTEPGDVVNPPEIAPPAPVANQPPQRSDAPGPSVNQIPSSPQAQPSDAPITVNTLGVSATPNVNPSSNPYVSQPIPQLHKNVV